MRSCSSSVLTKEATKEVASAHPGSPVLADQGQTGRWARRFEPKRPVRTMPVVVLEIDPEDLLQVTTANDQQPVQALSADGTDPPLRIQDAGGLSGQKLPPRRAVGRGVGSIP
jgi:hypothetical protein